MEVKLACPKDFETVRRYDRHIPSARLENCIRENQVYLLCEEGTVAGILRYSLFWQTIPFLDLIYLSETCRGQGYGSRMMAHWESIMRELGYRYAMLSTQADETAKCFYEKLDYRPVGAFRPPEQNADEILYVKQLSEKENAS